jgi:hypothetical protein
MDFSVKTPDFHVRVAAKKPWMFYVSFATSSTIINGQIRRKRIKREGENMKLYKVFSKSKMSKVLLILIISSSIDTAMFIQDNKVFANVIENDIQNNSSDSSTTDTVIVEPGQTTSADTINIPPEETIDYGNEIVHVPALRYDFQGEASSLFIKSPSLKVGDTFTLHFTSDVKWNDTAWDLHYRRTGESPNVSYKKIDVHTIEFTVVSEVNQLRIPLCIYLGTYADEKLDVAVEGEHVQNGRYTFATVINTELNNAQKDSDWLDQGVMLNGNLGRDYVLQNLNLPTVGYYGSKIEWSSDSPETIRPDGIVIRPDNEDKRMSLTAVVSFQGQTVINKFYIVVKRKTTTDDEAVALAKELLMEQFIKGNNHLLTEATDNLVLPTAWVENTTIEWHSDNPDVVTDTGIISKPVTSTASATLTAKISRGSVSDFKEFPVRVLHGGEIFVQTRPTIINTFKGRVSDLIINDPDLTSGDTFRLILSSDAKWSDSYKESGFLSELHYRKLDDRTLEFVVDNGNKPFFIPFYIELDGSYVGELSVSIDAMEAPIPSGRWTIANVISNTSNDSSNNHSHDRDSSSSSSGSSGGSDGSSSFVEKSGEKQEGEKEPEKPKEDSAEPKISFTDTKGHWAEEKMKEALQRGIVGGYPDGTFRPNEPVTRIQWISFIVRALKLQGDSKEITFTDSKQIPEWGKEALALALRENIISGYPDGSFRPNQEVTRAEMASILARVLKMEMKPDTEAAFSDYKEIPEWARGAVVALSKEGLIQGRGDNQFVPNDSATRAEAVVLLLTMLDRN